MHRLTQAILLEWIIIYIMFDLGLENISPIRMEMVTLPMYMKWKRTHSNMSHFWMKLERAPLNLTISFHLKGLWYIEHRLWAATFRHALCIVKEFSMLLVRTKYFEVEVIKNDFGNLWRIWKKKINPNGIFFFCKTDHFHRPTPSISSVLVGYKIPNRTSQ